MNLLKIAVIAAALSLSGAALAQTQPAGNVPAAGKEQQTQAVAAEPGVTPAAVAAATTPAPQIMAPTPGVGQPIPAQIGLQQQVTPTGRQALWMHDIVLMPILTAITILVLLLLFWVALRYNRAANAVPSKTSHNTLIEVIWTLLPVLLLVGMAIPSIGLLAAQYKPVGANAVTIKAIGNQWYWQYEYPDHGGFEVVSNMLPDDEAKRRGEPRLLGVDNRIVVPVGIPVRVLTTSNDVIHSWAVPALWTKMDAVPGRINETSFTIERAGVYYGQCSELCGARHGYMPIAVEAVPPAQFAQWIASKGGTMPGAKPATSAPALPSAAAASPGAAASSNAVVVPMAPVVTAPPTPAAPAAPAAATN